MDIFITIDKKDEEKFIIKARALKKELQSVKCDVRYIKTNENVQMKKISLCIAFSDDVDYIKRISTNEKLQIICITSKLEGKYILSVLEFVKDIYFLNTPTKEMVYRILDFVKKYELRKRCMRGSINAF